MKQSAPILNSCLLFLAAFFVTGIVWTWHRIPTKQVLEDRTPTSEEEDSTSTSPTPSVRPTTLPSQVSSTPTSSTTTSSPTPTPSQVNTVIPESKTLNVPFTSQAPEKNWDQPWQDACEEAALLMLDAYYKKYSLSPLFAKDELLKMISYEEKKGWGGSIPIEHVKEVGEKVLGLQSHGTLEIIENPSVEDIKKAIAAGDPVYVVADGKVLPNSNFTNGGPEYHALVITGYTKDTFITNDPGTRLGEDYVYKIPDLMNAIRDWNNGNVKQGRRVIMVVR